MDTITGIAKTFALWHGGKAFYPAAVASVLADSTDAQWEAWAYQAGVEAPTDDLVKAAIVAVTYFELR